MVPEITAGACFEGIKRKRVIPSRPNEAFAVGSRMAGNFPSFYAASGLY